MKCDCLNIKPKPAYKSDFTVLICMTDNFALIILHGLFILSSNYQAKIQGFDSRV